MKKFFFLVLATSLFISLQGCAGLFAAAGVSLYNYNGNVFGNDSEVSIENDDFKKLTSFKGKDIGEWGDNLYIRAWKKYDSMDVIYQIYIGDQFNGDWRFYESAFDSNGNKLPVTKIASKVQSCSSGYCSLKEHVGISVNKDYLQDSIKSGISIKLYGKAGQEIFEIPSEYIQNFLTRVEEYKMNQS